MQPIEEGSVAVKKRLKMAKDPKEILELERLRLQYIIQEEVPVSFLTVYRTIR